MSIQIQVPIAELQKYKIMVGTPMYGSQCLGMFSRSIADLTSVCTHYKIGLAMHYLFNESLIPRARNYICIPYNSIIETEDGPKSMKWIVDNRYKGKVLSISKTGKLEWNKVLNHWSRPNNENKKWIVVNTSKKRKQLICTEDHKCLVFKNPLNPVLEYVEAKDTVGTYSVRYIKNNQNYRNENSLYNKEQISAIIGTLLGDGHIAKNGMLQINHCEDQHEYIKLKQYIFGGTLGKTVAYKEISNGFKKTEYYGYKLSSPVNCQTKFLRNLAYDQYGVKKISKLIEHIDELSLAIWYMDDGSYNNGKSNGAYPTCSLSTHGFSYDEQLLIQEMFRDKWNIDVKLCKQGTYTYIQFSNNSSLKFWNLIEKYIIPSMRYKLPENFQYSETHKFNNNLLEYSGAKVLNVYEKNYGGKSKFKKLNSDLYDIEVENNHNFIANGSFVSNCDEFMRSDCTHLMFIDADIGFNANDIIAMLAIQISDPDKYNVVTAAYPKKSHHKDNMVYTEYGWKTIHELVESKFTGKVASLGKYGNLEWKSVIGHSRAPHKGAPWVKIKAQNQKGDIVTADHKVAVMENPLLPFNIKWKEAKDLTIIDYVVRMPNKRQGTNNENAFYSPDQISLLIGTLLGDGSIDSKGYLKFGHSITQTEYIKYKAELFGGVVSEPKNNNSYKNKQYFAQFLYPPRNDQISYLRDMVYINGKKSITRIVDYINDKSLAMWYMDDGSLIKNGNGYNVILCTENFGDENHIIVDMLKYKFDINATLNKCNNGNRIRISVDSYDKFFKTISPYIINSMKYKIPEQYHTNFVPPNFKKLDICAKKVTVEYVDTKSDQYDITVEDNHNFVSNHYIVENCISWEKIKQAVEKGYADQDPNMLEKFVGDYVFNPVPGTTEMQLNAPVEIMEAGTGFMLISRKTFEMFRDSYSELHYKPDHVRTTNFDGSREIMAYFDCVIDRNYTFGEMRKIIDAVSQITQKDLDERHDDVKLLVSKATELLEREKTSSKRYLSEDYYFCQYLRKIGGKIWLCPWMKLSHTGSYVFGGSLIDLAMIGASATADAVLLDKAKKRS